MELRVKKEVLGREFMHIESCSNTYLKVFYSNKHKAMVGEVLSSYIPTESFIDSFSSILKFAEKNDDKIEKFIFDKRALRAFNQTTMEWYYIQWKEEMLKHGVTKHRKILPSEPWFKKCVEAGKVEIKENYPDSPVHDLDIQYYSTIKDCISF